MAYAEINSYYACEKSKFQNFLTFFYFLHIWYILYYGIVDYPLGVHDFAVVLEVVCVNQIFENCTVLFFEEIMYIV